MKNDRSILIVLFGIYDEDNRGCVGILMAAECVCVLLGVGNASWLAPPVLYIYLSVIVSSQLVKIQSTWFD